MRTWIKRTASAAGACLLVAAGLGTSPAAGAAVVDEVVVPSSIAVHADSGDTVYQWGIGGVDFAFDTTGHTVHAGDTFGLDFPAGFRVVTATFPVLDESTKAVIANCATTPDSDGATAHVGCVFTDFVATHSPTRGAVSTRVQFTRAVTTETVTFTVGGTKVEVDLPGQGGIRPASTPPLTAVRKQGFFSDDARTKLKWAVQVPASALTSGMDLHVVDHLPATIGDPTYLAVESTPNVAGWAEAENWTPVPGAVITSQTGHLIDVTIPASSLDRTRVYRVAYDTLVTQADALSFANDADVSGTKVSEVVTRDTTGAGTGNGTDQPTSTTTTSTSATSTTPPTTTSATSTTPPTTTSATSTTLPTTTTSSPGAGATTGNLPAGSVTGGFGPLLLLGSLGVGSLALGGVCTGAIPLPVWLQRLLPPFCPGAPHTTVVAPGPSVPNGRG